MPGHTDSLQVLTDLIRVGLLSAPKEGLKKFMEAIFGERYQKRHYEASMLRDAYALAKDEEESGVPYAGFINPDNPPSGP